MMAQKKMERLTSQETVKDLQRSARKALEKAYARYSGFHVGAALLTERGGIYTGCNIENVSYGLTNCAERVAIGSAIAAEGKGMRIAAIAIAAKARNKRGAKMTVRDASPCGACRQVIAEFADPSCQVYYRHEGNRVNRTIGELLQDAFFPPSLT